MIGASRYFASRYFAPTYWPKLGDVVTIVDATPDVVIVARGQATIIRGPKRKKVVAR